MTDPTRNLNTDHERAVLRLANVGKSFGNVSVLKNIDLVVKQGETVAIIGPSGSGKTTLLRCINFLETYDEGSVFVVDELVGYRQIGDRRKLDTDANISRARRRTGMVFQRFALFPHKTVVQNLIEGPVHVLGIASVVAMERAMAVLQSVGLAAKANAYPSQLSGGQQQRVGIARALCMDPEILLFDEVTSALDPELVGEVLAVMKDLSLQRRTMVVVTHELRFARDVADRMVFMEHGSIVADLPTTEFFENPPNDRIRAFLRASAGK